MVITFIFVRLTVLLNIVVMRKVKENCIILKSLVMGVMESYKIVVITSMEKVLDD